MYKTKSGKAHPLGATPDANGVNFSIFSENAISVKLLLFNKHNDLDPFLEIDIDHITNRTFHFWHVYVEGLKPGTHYAYRIDGQRDVSSGHRFNPNKILLDPYSKGNTNDLWNRVDACGEDDNLHSSMRSVVIDSGNYDWEGDTALNLPIKDSIIYEMHVRGFTKGEGSNVKHPGSFRGIIEKIPYLKSLGITAVELLPIFEFDSKEILKVKQNGEELSNYWGYSTYSFFAPHAMYCINPEVGNHINEFRDMVKALHKAGIEIILDVVFNHSSEGNHQGPTINFKGIDNSIYYYLSPESREFYFDFSGCGNTINCNHPVVEKFITDCLAYWINEMHIDGLRFDEGSILSRGEDGIPLKHPPVLWTLELAEIFSSTKLIAEAWDAAGLYQIGNFTGFRWSEWNGKYRDSCRRFLKGDVEQIGDVAARVAGSADLYQHSRHRPTNSINFMACHDGMTLMDLVSYNRKNNWANGEENNDGIDENLSWNSGIEGETDDQSIILFRKQRIKNFLSVLFLSTGVPMILSGDEVGKSQKGNNNVYCQDNDLAWFDWSLVDRNADLLRFTQKIIEFRRNCSNLRRSYFYLGNINERGLADISWHGCQLNSPGWYDDNSRVLAFTIASFVDSDPDIHVMMNMDSQNLDFEIPNIEDRKWYRFVDSSLDSPNDILSKNNVKLCKEKLYNVNSYSIAILISK
jgi:isoamylase